MQQEDNSQINISRKRDKRTMIPAITVHDPYSDMSRFNDMGFALVSPDIVPLQSSLNRSSPEFGNNPFFGPEAVNLINSPYKDTHAMYDSNYRPVSPTRHRNKGSTQNYKLFTSYKKLISNESSVSNMFGLPSPQQLVQPLNFNYDESVFDLVDKSSKLINKQTSGPAKENTDLNLNLLKIHNNGQLKVIEDSKSKYGGCSVSMERFSLCIQTELKHLDKLFALLVKIFTRKELIEADIMLNINELRVLNYILHRKFLKRLNSKDLESSVSTQLSKLTSIITSKSHKRPEECYKFIFTRVLKFLKKSFRKNFNIKQNLDEQFYGYYFAELSEKNQESLDTYYYPLTKKDNKKETLNSSYFNKIFQSKNFINDLVKYVNEHLNEEYKAEIIQKLENLLLKWDPHFTEEGHKLDRSIDEIKMYLMKNKRCKLPWTLDEVKEAVLRVYSLIDTHSNSNLSVTLDKSVLFQ